MEHLTIVAIIYLCHKLTKIAPYSKDLSIEYILSLCGVNPLLQELLYCTSGITIPALIELIHTCPQLHTLRLPYERNFTDIGILALSEPMPSTAVVKCKNI